MMATRFTFGAISLSMSNSFDPTETSAFVKPVTLPPGCAKLWIKPCSTGSLTSTNTIGTVRLIFNKFDTAPLVLAKTRSGFSASSSELPTATLSASTASQR